MDSGYGNWILAAVNIIIFVFFLKSVFKPQNPTDWTTYRSLAAFFVALFAEMYGFPLTIYLLASTFGSKLNIDLTHNSGHLLETLLGIKGDPHFSLLHIGGNILVGAGFLMVASAWQTLYTAVKAKKIAVTGLYKYLRHPQYIGFSIIILGFLLQWPTLITLVMAPFLWWRYWRLAKAEEKELLISHRLKFPPYPLPNNIQPYRSQSVHPHPPHYSPNSLKSQNLLQKRQKY